MPIVFDLEKEKWMMAENEEVIKNVSENGSYQQEVFSFRDNCSTTILETSNEVVKLFVTGGNNHKKVYDKAYGISFVYSYKAGLKDIQGLKQVELPDLPTPLYLHQSAVVKIDGEEHLIVMGGKESIDSYQSLNTVYKLKIKNFIGKRQDQMEAIENIMQKKNLKGKNLYLWEQCLPMINTRSMFASTVIDHKFIYVYGGISQGIQASDFPGKNQLPKYLVERYDAIADSWSEIIIQNAPNLSSFGWC